MLMRIFWLLCSLPRARVCWSQQLKAADVALRQREQQLELQVRAAEMRDVWTRAEHRFAARFAPCVLLPASSVTSVTPVTGASEQRS